MVTIRLTEKLIQARKVTSHSLCNGQAFKDGEVEKAHIFEVKTEAWDKPEDLEALD
jgi:hypothetical protein